MDTYLNVTAETLATYAGVVNDGEGESDRLLKAQLGIVQHSTHSRESPIHYEVAAKYLPALINKFRANDEVLTPTVTLLNVISHTPYFVRFLQTPAGQGIAILQAERMANAIAPIDSMPVDKIGEIGQFLSTLLVLEGTSNIDNSTIEKLIPKLKICQRQFPRSLASETCGRCIEQLRNDVPMRYMVKSMKEMLEASLNKCGAPSCERKTQESGSDLMQCSRCKTKVYCGAAHQKADWAKHKLLCFPPNF